MLKFFEIMTKTMLVFASIIFFIFFAAIADSLARQAAMMQKYKIDTSNDFFIANVGALYIYESKNGKIYTKWGAE